MAVLSAQTASINAEFILDWLKYLMTFLLLALAAALLFAMLAPNVITVAAAAATASLWLIPLIIIPIIAIVVIGSILNNLYNNFNNFFGAPFNYSPRPIVFTTPSYQQPRYYSSLGNFFGSHTHNHPNRAHNHHYSVPIRSENTSVHTTSHNLFANSGRSHTHPDAHFNHSNAGRNNHGHR